MNKKELFKTSSQNGVTMYIDKSLNAVVDMDVEDWVTAIWFNSNVEMRDCDKKFPNVKKLIIGPTVDKININNETFPGVKHIDSKNIYYIPEISYILISISYDSENIFHQMKMIQLTCLLLIKLRHMLFMDAGAPT